MRLNLKVTCGLHQCASCTPCAQWGSARSSTFNGLLGNTWRLRVTLRCICVIKKKSPFLTCSLNWCARCHSSFESYLNSYWFLVMFGVISRLIPQHSCGRVYWYWDLDFPDLIGLCKIELRGNRIKSIQHIGLQRRSFHWEKSTVLFSTNVSHQVTIYCSWSIEVTLSDVLEVLQFLSSTHNIRATRK